MLPELTRRWVIPTTGALTLAGAGCDSGKAALSEPTPAVEADTDTDADSDSDTDADTDSDTDTDGPSIVGDWTANEFWNGYGTYEMPYVYENGEGRMTVSSMRMRVNPNGSVLFGTTFSSYTDGVLDYSYVEPFPGTASPNGDGTHGVDIPQFGNLVMTCAPAADTMACDGSGMTDISIAFDRD